MSSNTFLQRLRRMITPHTRAYFDYAAATPVRPEVHRAMAPYFSTSFGNPGGIHEEGQHAKRAVALARESIARTLRVRTEEVIFTANGTESNNLAILGIVEALRHSGRSYDSMEIITLPTEHPSVLETIAALERKGVVVQKLSVTPDGLLDISALEAALSERTVLMALAYANSETGVIQDIKRVTRTIRNFKDAHASRKEKMLPYVLLDASQAPVYLPCALDSLGVDLMTLDAGKCYGPKGVGVLIVRGGIALLPTLYGGGQERGLRPGTENVPLIVGCAKAIVRAQEEHEPAAAHVTALREYFFDRITEEFPDALINGSRTSRIANNVNISILGLDGEYAVVALDRKGIAASTRSACGSAEGSGSHVVMSMTGDASRAQSTIRFTIGTATTRREIDSAIAALRAHYTIASRTPKPIR